MSESVLRSFKDSNNQTNVRREGGRRIRHMGLSEANKGVLISVITVTFNAATHLERAILSVLNQTYPNIEYLIIDGGSTDETLAILSRYSDQIDYWISEPDAGIYDAMNKGVALAKGSWLYFLGADDILVDCLHHLVRHLRNEQTILYGEVYMPVRNKVYAGRFDVIKLVNQNICQQAILYPASVFERYSFSIQYPGAADYELNLRCWGDKFFKFRYVPKLIAIFNDEWTRQPDLDFAADKPQIINRTVRRQFFFAQVCLNAKKLLLQAFIRNGQ